MSKQDGRSRRVTEEPSDDLTATILHLDMDAFFASVELLDHPELKGKPIVVGGASRRGVVAAANYEARRYGVNSAMAMATALRLCPNAVILPPRFERYEHFSRIVHEVCLSFTPAVEQLSIDEAYLDVSGALQLFGTPYRIAEALRRRVREATGLPCSVGAAAAKSVAKLASGMAKPEGVLLVPAAETVEFLRPLAARALAGVGAATAETLERIGLRTVADLQDAPEGLLESTLGSAAGASVRRLAIGAGGSEVTVERQEKSLGHSVTFEEDVADAASIERTLLALSEKLGGRLRAAGARARVIAITLRRPDFTTISRSRTLEESVDGTLAVHRAAVELYRASGLAGSPLRLVGVRAEKLDSGGQTSLWSEEGRWPEAERAADALRERFGRGAVRPASLLGGDPGDRRPGGYGGAEGAGGARG